MKVTRQSSLKENGKVMAFQVFMTTVFTVILVTAIHYIIMTHRHARPELLWCTFIFALVLDQVKTLLFLTLVWYVLIKRCGYLSQNEKDYVVVDDPVNLKEEKFLPRLKVFCLKVLESSYFENGSFALISIYTLFIFYWLALSDILELVSTDTLSVIDIIFTSLFLSEI